MNSFKFSLISVLLLVAATTYGQTIGSTNSTITVAGKLAVKKADTTLTLPVFLFAFKGDTAVKYRTDSLLAHATGGGDPQTWEQTLTTQGSTPFTTDNEIDFNNRNLSMLNSASFAFGQIDTLTGISSAINLNSTFIDFDRINPNSHTLHYVDIYDDSVYMASQSQVSGEQHETGLSITPDYVRIQRLYNQDGQFNPKIIYAPDTLLTTPEFIYVSDNDTIKKYPFSGGSQTWQQTLDNGSDLNKNNYSAFDGYSFVMQGGAVSMSLDDRPGSEAVQLAAGSDGSANLILDGVNNRGWSLQGLPHGDTSRVEFSGFGSTGTIHFKADTIDINNAYKLPVIDGAAGQVLTTDGLGTASWQDGGGGSSLFPTAGTATATATATVTGELAGNDFHITNDDNPLFTIQSGFAQLRGFIDNDNYSTLDLGGEGPSFYIAATVAGEQTGILGVGAGKTISYTASTHTFNGIAILATQYTPTDDSDNTYPNGSLTQDDTNIYYRTSTGTWVKIPWQTF